MSTELDPRDTSLPWEVLCELDDPEAMEPMNLDTFRGTRREPEAPEAAGHPLWFTVAVSFVAGAAVMLWTLQAMGVCPR